MFHSRRCIDPALLQAVIKDVRSRLPAGEPLTLEGLEDAILSAFKELGPAVAEEIASPTTESQKKGHRRSVAGSPPAGLAGDKEC